MEKQIDVSFQIFILKSILLNFKNKFCYEFYVNNLYGSTWYKCKLHVQRGLFALVLKDVILLSMEGCDPEIKEQTKPNNSVEAPVSTKAKHL